MPETADFNAIRISLAAPEQIRSWSYGEVTKPETINYRTLKPEKDGLFCERIFGPTKDFECYCGKYKRVRYKGIICDRCGVEVARSKVRRERMGHIELAAPVSHIWFAKGAPSRVGLLLDISPRSLERVLYFAQYIVTNVDDAARAKALTKLRGEQEGEDGKLIKPLEDKITGIQTKLNEKIAELEATKAKDIKRLESDDSTVRGKVTKALNTLEKSLGAQVGKKAARDVVFEGEVLVEKGKNITATTIKNLKKMAGQMIAHREKGTGHSVEKIQSQIDDLRAEAAKELDQLHEELTDKHKEQDTKFDSQEFELTRKLQVKSLLTEQEYKSLKERYGPMFLAGMGAEAILDVLQKIDLDKNKEDLQSHVNSSSGQKRKKAIKQLRVVEALRKSGNKPEWMILTVLPILPPDLRPMVQLDGGRFATSDLNDLYRRTINRNNRLKRLLELGAPEIITRNEKRMLQEAVDALIDNGRHGRAISGSHNHKLKSLSDMLRGKQGRFRQNLLGKRVDYSGRSVIVVGPELKLNQCGLPKKMALELFKPFVMHKLVALGLAHNIKSAKRMVERVKPEVWDVLEDVIKGRPVLLNRAPTLHRLGIQAFMPVLIEGSAIQVHPLVCTAFNADFDGDQMAVHVPLSKAAVLEAQQIMLSTYNMLSPSSGEPVVSPTLDMVLGCFYLTFLKKGAKGEGRIFANYGEAKLAYELSRLDADTPMDLQAEIEVRVPEDLEVTTSKGPVTLAHNGRLKTSIGRIIFNETMPAGMKFYNDLVDKGRLKLLIAECYQKLGNEGTANVLDAIKKTGFHYATISGVTIAINDIEVPKSKPALMNKADKQIAEVEKQYQRGLITEKERYTNTVKIWNDTANEMEGIIKQALPNYGGVYMMATSGAKGNIAQIKQMAGMRGLMTDPKGRIIDLPIKSSFREGLSVLEYFISTHGARKGLADTALRTADSGYLTRRLVDGAQDVIVLAEDCETNQGVWIQDDPENTILGSLYEKILGRVTAAAIVDQKTGEVLIDRNVLLDEDLTKQAIALCEKARDKILKETKSKEKAATAMGIYVRSALTCETRRGICRLCYGRSLARGTLVQIGEAVGIIAAQSIGEPGTQLTMRTFHTGGIVGIDITSGLPRVEELFEARSPKGQSVISEIDGEVEIVESSDGRKVIIRSTEVYKDEYPLPAGYELAIKNNDHVEVGMVIARPADSGKKGDKGEPIIARLAGKAEVRKKQIDIQYEEQEQREYQIPAAQRIAVEDGGKVKAGSQITEGPLNPQDILRVLGREAVQRYLVTEIQKVYRTQGVTINNKHIEVIVRQMLRRVRVDSPGDTDLLPGELGDRFEYEDLNAKILAEGGEPATAQAVLLGITKASLSTSSFLAAASFQETARVLTEAAINGSTDKLRGLKENVIIGRLIPGRFDLTKPELPEPAAVPALSFGDAPEIKEWETETSNK
ncbi:MAG: DNA-directed RNA polymerase subunit beta' [Dehalococcoidia bacterium]|nr:DNA-directed RNA polymerase subunit beta' [Dehalococcoidia bacterium]